jgi:hypothetical protein
VERLVVRWAVSLAADTRGALIGSPSRPQADRLEGTASQAGSQLHGGGIPGVEQIGARSVAFNVPIQYTRVVKYCQFSESHSG